MREAGLQGVSPRSRVRTTRRGDGHPAPDLVQRQFEAGAPDRLWVADITSVPTASGFLYLAVVTGAWSRRVVGWSMASHLKTKLVFDALNMAVPRRQPSEVVHRSGQGTQFPSVAFGQRCEEAGVRPSMGSVGDACDNALCDSSFRILKCELIDRTSLRSFTHARWEVFEYIEGWYTPHRRHSALDYESPTSYEQRKEATAALDPKRSPDHQSGSTSCTMRGVYPVLWNRVEVGRSGGRVNVA